MPGPRGRHGWRGGRGVQRGQVSRVVEPCLLILLQERDQHGYELIAALEREPGTACPVCRGERLMWRHDLDHEPSAGPVCTDCGILVPRPVLTPGALAEARRARLLVSA